jgi:hypothetical protein
VDFDKIISELKGERDALVRTIASLEEMARDDQAQLPTPKKGRGRKAMGPAERLTVSERMKRYWASGRSENGARE